MSEEIEWSFKKWSVVGGEISIYHSEKFCNPTLFYNIRSDHTGYTYGMADQGVCHTCKKPFPDHIKLQWKLAGWGWNG